MSSLCQDDRTARPPDKQTHRTKSLLRVVLLLSCIVVVGLIAAEGIVLFARGAMVSFEEIAAVDAINEIERTFQCVFPKGVSQAHAAMMRGRSLETVIVKIQTDRESLESFFASFRDSEGKWGERTFVRSEASSPELT